MLRRVLVRKRVGREIVGGACADKHILTDADEFDEPKHAREY
jgi:hypothetical protein